MNKPNKCKNCQWYGKPYWSIINPCDSCPNEDNVEIITIGDVKPIKECLTEEEIKKAMTDKSIFQITLEEKDKEIERLNNENNQYKEYVKELKDSLRNYHIKNNKLINKNERLNNIVDELEKTFFNDDKLIKEYNIEHPERPLDNYSRYYLDKLKELKEGK